MRPDPSEAPPLASAKRIRPFENSTTLLLITKSFSEQYFPARRRVYFILYLYYIPKCHSSTCSREPAKIACPPTLAPNTCLLIYILLEVVRDTPHTNWIHSIPRDWPARRRTGAPKQSPTALNHTIVYFAGRPACAYRFFRGESNAKILKISKSPRK